PGRRARARGLPRLADLQARARDGQAGGVVPCWEPGSPAWTRARHGRRPEALADRRLHRRRDARRGRHGSRVPGPEGRRRRLRRDKVLLNGAASPEERKRFRREIALTRRVSHKNVIHIHDSGETEDGLTYLVVPALVGKELRSLLDAASGKGLPPELA